MSAVFRKLNLKDHTDIVVINAPSSFEPEPRQLSAVNIHRDLNALVRNFP